MHPQFLFISLSVILVLVIIAAILFRNKKYLDYFGIFIVGMVWSLVGLMLGNFAMTLFGLILIFTGVIHKNRWKRDPLAWDDLSRQQKWRRIIVVGLGILLLIAVLFAILFLRWQFELPKEFLPTALPK